ncbi:MAG: right-handed parallel beta-helix repeat-containing protein [Bacteroidales bacterium]|nr:right-handed parallel beta-helix repeat-containing protein [Bacteroidales bacterium]
MPRFLTSILLLLPILAKAFTIDVPAVQGDATSTLQAALEQAKAHPHERVTIRLQPHTYIISRADAGKSIYHVSNTASEIENSDPTKHIALLFKDMANVTLDGNGATLLTKGELTTFVIDNCNNIRLTDFTLGANDPSVPEFRVIDVDSASFKARITNPSNFMINDGRFFFTGRGWTLPHENRPFISQVFYPERNETARIANPLNGYISADSVGPRTVMFHFEKSPNVKCGEVYQFRHSIRNEVCGLIVDSKDITLENIRFNFMGNFGVVSQMSENITVESVTCGVPPQSDRTCAGFADFLQFSSCKGLIKIHNCSFEGSHDDPINIHGTHLQVVRADSETVAVKYMHPQTFGFPPAQVGDSIEFVDKASLLGVFATSVKDIQAVDLYTYNIVLTDKLPEELNPDNLVIENITCTPEVVISENRFARTPTRGILISTRRKSLIVNNLFFRIPMPAILVSDDARNWYESGPVYDLTIRDNIFFECASPAILIKPETVSPDAVVHKNIVIENNSFVNQPTPAIEVYGAEPVLIQNNNFKNP